MTTHHDPQKAARIASQQALGAPEASDSIEAAILRRRRVLKKAAWLGVPLILSLHGQAFAKKKSAGAATAGSGGMSGNTSQPP